MLKKPFHKKAGIYFLTIFLSLNAFGQDLADFIGDEYVLYAETKQINQFFRRFNAEELPNGKRLYTKDSLYRSEVLRREYLDLIIDQQTPLIESDIKESFVKEVLENDNPLWLDFYGGKWFAEVSTTFSFQGKERKVTLFMTLEKAQVGSKWVFSNVYFAHFQKVFGQNNVSLPNPPFIHPMSHELDFMNLIKVFRNGGNLEPYARKEYVPDYLTLFLYEIKKGNLVFRSVDQVKFHFLQLDGWYFELSDVLRSGTNRGWIITQLTPVPEGGEGDLLNFIYRK